MSWCSSICECRRRLLNYIFTYLNIILQLTFWLSLVQIEDEAKQNQNFYYYYFPWMENIKNLQFLKIEFRRNELNWFLTLHLPAYPPYNIRHIIIITITFISHVNDECLMFIDCITFKISNGYDVHLLPEVISIVMAKTAILSFCKLIP